MSGVPGPRPSARDPEVPRRNAMCKAHGTTEFALYQRSNGNGSPGWRCMRCRAEASARTNARKRKGNA